MHFNHFLSAYLPNTAYGGARLFGDMLAVVKKTAGEGVSLVLDTPVQRRFSEDFIRRQIKTVAARKAQVLKTDPRVFCHIFRLYAKTEMAPRLDKITAPTLVLTGEWDGGCPPRLNHRIAKQLPNGELVVLGGLKHAVLPEAPKKVFSALRKFLSQ